LVAVAEPALAGSPFLFAAAPLPMPPLPNPPSLDDLRKQLFWYHFNYTRNRLAQLTEHLIETDEAKLAVDVNGKVHGSVFIGNLQNRGLPVGQLTVTNSTDVTGTIYIPKKDDKGEFTQYETLRVTKEGVIGTIPLGTGSFIEFDKGFSKAEFTSGQLTYTIDKNGVIERTDLQTGKTVRVDVRKEQFEIKVPGLGSFKVGKSGIELTFENKLVLKWEWDENLTTTRVGAEIFLGGIGSLNFGYSQEMGQQLRLNIKHQGIDLRAEYRKDNLRLEGSYSWAGRREPNPIQGRAGLGLEVNRQTATAQFFLEISY
jgi:hypothetical protein